MYDYVRKDLVEELIHKYYDKFKYDSDADELLVDLDAMEGVELAHCKECPNYGMCNFMCDVDFVGC